MQIIGASSLNSYNLRLQQERYFIRWSPDGQYRSRSHVPRLASATRPLSRTFAATLEAKYRTCKRRVAAPTISNMNLASGIDISDTLGLLYPDFCFVLF